MRTSALAALVALASLAPPVARAEDIGVTPADQHPATAPRNHSPRFVADEAALPVGVRTMTMLALEFLRAGGRAARAAADGERETAPSIDVRR